MGGVRNIVRRQSACAAAILLISSSCVPAQKPQAAPLPPAVLPPATSPTATITPPKPVVGQGSDLRLLGEPQQGGIVQGIVPAGTQSLLLDGKPVPVAPDGRFLIAFDRDASNAASLRVSLADGRVIDRYLPVRPGNWRIENVDANPTGGVTSEEFQRVRAGELAQINAARLLHPPSDGWRQKFIWPTRGRVSGLFGSQRIYRGTPGSYHSGLDMAVPTGTPFAAPADGVVVLAATTPFSLEGYLLIVDHGMGLTSAFLHCSRLDVKAGDVVRQGQVLGATGATGRASGPHLHWGMKWNDARIDPLPLVTP